MTDRPILPLAEVERAAIEAALRACHGNRTAAARALGISVRTIRNRLRDWGLSGALPSQPEDAP